MLEMDLTYASRVLEGVSIAIRHILKYSIFLAAFPFSGGSLKILNKKIMIAHYTKVKQNWDTSIHFCMTQLY